MSDDLLTRMRSASSLGAAIKALDEGADEIERLRALLREAREHWIKVGYGASHEDVAECRDFCDRIDLELSK